MAERAGFDRLMVTPAGMGWLNSGEYVALDNAEWQETIAAVRQVFSGKLGVGNLPMYTPFEGYTYHREADFIIFDSLVDRVTSGLTADDMDGLVAAWKEYLESPWVAQLNDMPEVWQALIISSYDGVLEHGWIEPGGRYPDLVSDYRVQAVVYEAFLRVLYETPNTPVNGVVSMGYNWHDYIYPNQHEIRDDLSQSIRGKDAESVFHRWTTIFE